MSGSSANPLAVITGASSGLGEGYADRLAGRGHDLLIIARRQDRLEALAKRMRSRHGVRVEVKTADLAQEDELEAVEQRVIAQSPAVLVNNAGSGAFGGAGDLSAEDLGSMVRLNIIALTRLSQTALACFRRSTSGSLINIGSVIGVHPSATAAAYSGTKAYVLNYTQSLQLEFANAPIRIQLVQPGPVRTEFFDAADIREDLYPPEAYLSAEQVVDAALAGLDRGELVTTPTILDEILWKTLEATRGAFLKAARSGRVAHRYEVQAKEEQ